MKLFPKTVHKRLLLRLAIYGVVSILMLGVALFHIVEDHANILWTGIGFIAGVGVGLVVSRMFKISWDGAAEQVIGKIDVVGVGILILYVVFEINREKIVEHFISGASVIAVSFAVLSGLMYGRVLGIRGKIKKVFQSQGLS